ncbi:glycosyltransferase [Vibrio vulnificus]|nr:glycosyltransferase [Vibrio vulnificus]
MIAKPKVTVYITTHNRCRKLIRAFYSVLLQDYDNLEIIISDDGSSDETQFYGEKLSKKFSNVIYVRNESPRGANSARNNALNIATGYFVTGLDDDDIFTKSRISLFLNCWNDQYAFICDNLENRYKNSYRDDFKQNGNQSISTREMLLTNNASNQVFTKLEYLNSIGGFNEELKKFQDWDCWLRLSHRYGSGLRMNNKTYVMYHDEETRVSNNQKNEEAFKILVENNRIIYLNFYSNSFIERYLLEKKPANFLDIIHCRNFKEVVRVIRKVKFFRMLKNILPYA